MLTLRTLGSASLITAAGEEITAVISQPKRFALLVYLAVPHPGRLHRRDTLLPLFWPDRDDPHARNALSQSLSHLRSNLPRGVVTRRGAGEVGLAREAIRVDVSEFETAIAGGHWAEALEWYGGSFLQGLHIGNSSGFEEWMEGERERLREKAAGAAWALAKEQVERGALVEAERTAQRALKFVWTDETPVRDFIQALAAAGDRAAAINLYDKFSSRLREGLEVEPSEYTVRIAEGIRNGDLAVPLPSPGTAEPGGLSPSGPLENTAEGGRAEGDEQGEHPKPAGRTGMGKGAEATAAGGKPPTPSGVWKWGRWALGALGISVLVLAGTGLRPGKGWSPAARVLAVAPFQNRTGDPELDGLGSVLAADLHWALGHAGIVDVIPHPVVEEALSGAGPEADHVSVLARETGAGVVVTGDLLLRGDSVLAQAACLDSETLEALCPVQRVSRPKSDQSGLAEKMLGGVAAALAQHFDTVLALDPDLIPPPVKLEAYREYRRGFEIYRLGGSHQDAMEHFHRAWGLDSTYLAPPLRLMAFYSARPHRRPQYDSILPALESYRQGMTRYQRHHYDGLRLSAEGQQELAYREFLAMAEIGRFEAASGLAEMALLTNRIEKSIEAAGWLDKGNGEFLEPFVQFWQGYWSLYTYALHLGGRYEKELEIAREWGDRFPAARYYPVQAKAKALAGLGRVEDLEPIVEERRAAGRLQAIWKLADELWVHGHEAAARAVLEGEVERFETDSAYIGRFNNQAMVLHRLGRDEEAHTLWEEGVNLSREDPWAWGVARIGYSAALVGDSAQAREMEHLLMNLDGLPPGDDIYVPFLQAKIAAALGEKDRAVRILEEWGRSGINLFWLNNLHSDFTFQSLLGDYPPFRVLMIPKG